MIDKINGNGNYDFPGSQKKKNPAVRAYENTPGAKEAAQKQAAGIHKKNSPHASGQKDAGVILDLSGKASDRNKNAYAAGRKKESSWKDVLRKLFSPVVQWLKDFWSSDSAQDDQEKLPELEAGNENAEMEAVEVQSGQDAQPADSGLSAELSSDISDMDLPPLEAADQDEELKALADAAVKSGNLQQLERFVTQNGAKRLAHNSDLLTYYDRRGKFVEMDETEKHRVLFGDKNVLKL